MFLGANMECKSAVSISGAASTSSPRSPSGSISGLVLFLRRGRREGQTFGPVSGLIFGFGSRFEPGSRLDVLVFPD